ESEQVLRELLVPPVLIPPPRGVLRPQGRQDSSLLTLEEAVQDIPGLLLVRHTSPRLRQDPARTLRGRRRVRRRSLPASRDMQRRTLVLSVTTRSRHVHQGALLVRGHPRATDRRRHGRRLLGKVAAQLLGNVELDVHALRVPEPR